MDVFVWVIVGLLSLGVVTSIGSLGSAAPWPRKSESKASTAAITLVIQAGLLVWALYLLLVAE